MSKVSLNYSDGKQIEQLLQSYIAEVVRRLEIIEQKIDNLVVDETDGGSEK